MRSLRGALRAAFASGSRGGPTLAKRLALGCGGLLLVGVASIQAQAPAPGKASDTPKKPDTLEVDCGRDNLKDGEQRVKEVKEHSVKILLTKRDGVLTAVSAKCTHFGCGVESTVCGDVATCACHGAQFNVRTGDVLNAPAMDDLPLYRVRVSNGQVVVTVPLGANAAVPKFGHKCKCKGESQVVIVGGGAAGLITAQTLRQEGFKGRIVIISKEDSLPYDRTMLSKMIDLPRDYTLRSDTFFGVNDIELWRGREIVSVNTANKKLAFLDGAELEYDSLVIATGGIARMRTIPGAGGELSNVFCLRTLDDARKIKDAVDPQSRVVVVGSSFIGMEAAASLIQRLKVKDVTVIGIEDVAFEKVFGARVGKALQQWHESNGVKFENASNVDRLDGSTEGRVTSVKLGNGKTLPADAVILGLGIVPASNWVSGPGFQKDRSGFLVVDEYLQAGPPDVYAVGDVCAFPYEGRHINVQHWAVAQQHGRVAAHNIVHRDARRAYTQPPFFWSNAYGKGIRFVGSVADGWDSVVLDGEPESLVFRAFYIKQNRVVAVVTMQRDPESAAAIELFQRKQMPTADAIAANPKLSLSDLVADIHKSATTAKQ